MTTPSSSDEPETTPESITHSIEVIDGSVITTSDSDGEYKQVIPKLLIDGKEAESFNNSLAKYINSEYEMKKDPEYSDWIIGYEVSYLWSSKDNIVSILLLLSSIEEEWYSYDVINFDVDTMRSPGDEEMTAFFGLSKEELFAKAGTLYRNWWDSEEWLRDSGDDLLNVSINDISYDTVTPLILPNGHMGMAGLLQIPAEAMDTVECFDLETMTHENYLPW